MEGGSNNNNHPHHQGAAAISASSSNASETTTSGGGASNNNSSRRRRGQQQEQEEEEQQLPPVVPVKESFSQRWTSAIDTVRQLICNSLKVITHWSATHPWITVWSVTCLSLGMITLGLMTNFTIETNGDVLWPPQGSTTQLHQQWIKHESQFSEELMFSVLYITGPSVGENILLLQDNNNNNDDDDKNGGGGGAYNSVSKVFEIYDAIQKLPLYDEVCGQPYTNPKTNVTMTCDTYGVIEFWNHSTSIFHNNTTTTNNNQVGTGREEAIVAQMSAKHYPSGKPVDRAHVFGNPIFVEKKNKTTTTGTGDSSSSSSSTGDSSDDNDEDLLVHNEAYRLDMIYPISETTTEFLQGVIDLVLDHNREEEYYKVELFTSRSFDDEFQEAIVQDIPLMPMAFGLMSCFCVLVFAKCDKVRSQALLGWGAVFGVLFAILTGYGLLFTIGIPLTSATQIIVFVMFGIGLDDAFIISGSYERTDHTKCAVDRIADTIDDIGLSIAITTLTSALAFAAGCISSLNTVYWLCLYAFPTILIDFFYQITFFMALIVLDDRRMQRQKMDCLVCITVHRKNSNDNDVDIEDKEEGGGEGDNNNNHGNGDEQQEENRPTETIKEQPHREEEELMSSRSSRFMDAYANFLLQPWVKATVLVAFTALLGACIWGTTQLRQEMDFRDLVPSDSYVKGYFNAQDEYFEPGLQSAGYFRFVDQSDPGIRKQMTKFVEDLYAQGAITEPPPYFWVRDFEDFVANIIYGTDATIVLATTFHKQLDAFLAHPLYNKLYATEIIRDPNTGDIINSRVWFHLGVDMTEAMDMINYLALTGDIAGSQPINEGIPQSDYRFFVHDENMNMWEFYNVVPKELTFTTVAGVVCVSIIGVAFIPHWTAILFVLPSILTVYIDLLGFLHFVGVRINPVSYITLVMSIGLLVDFIMHILLRYYECHDGSREDRVRETLRTMGSSILVGGVSTFLGVALLGFSTSTVFSTIFRAFIGLVVLGCSYGLILLPVVLSLVGPEDGYAKPTSSEDDVAALENTLKRGAKPDHPTQLEDSLDRNNIEEDTCRIIDEDITDEISV